MTRRAILFLMWIVCSLGASAQTAYKTPPKEITEIIDSPVLPLAVASPRGDAILLVENSPNPSIATLAAPVLRIAGIRINPALNSAQRIMEVTGLVVQRVSDKKTVRVEIPAGSKINHPAWSFDGAHIAFTRDAAGGAELWIADAATGKARALPNLRVSDALDAPFDWMSDNKRLLVAAVPSGRGAPPEAPKTPAGPIVEETAGKMAQVRTYQDLLKNPYDEALFEYYCSTQLAVADAQSGAITPIGALALYSRTSWSPNGEYLLVERLQKPFSYQVPYSEFAKTIEIWDKTGKVVRVAANLPVADQTPRQGVPLGPRSPQWQPLQPATLLWSEALDGGDPMRKADFRDKIIRLSAPFAGEAQEVMKIKHRFMGFGWTATKDRIVFTEFDRDRRWRTTYLTDVSKPKPETKTLFDLSVNDSYNNPGAPVYERRPNGERVMAQDGDWIYLSGAGASEKGDRPFLDKMNLKTLEKQRLYRSSETSYEQFLAFASSRANILTRYESKTEYPNYCVVELKNAKRQQLTSFKDPSPQLTALKKELIHYKRPDGTALSGTLYLPPNYQPKTRLPLIIWAYPLEYSDAATAGQTRTSPNRFTMRGRSYFMPYCALQGYAVLQDATMPVVGNPETMNDTFIEQITASAKAAIDYLDSVGVADRKRVAVAGHSYGAFMTANLLARTDLFAAGIACSGAYNRSLTPFGFQGERRSYWEATDVYTKLSPFAFANKIKKPLLMIHGEADNNSGTFPIQSQRLYQAIAGNGGTARLVMLPHESHGYSARESVAHVMSEIVEWADKYLKNADKPTK